MATLLTQQYNLNLIPGQNIVVVNAAAYDNSPRLIRFNMFNGAVAADISGWSARVEGTRQGTKAGFSTVCTVASPVVSFAITDAMTASSGKHQAAVVFYQGEERVASATFILNVAPAVLDESTPATEEDATIYQQWLAANTSQIQANANEISVLKGRMDEFASLPPGSTEGNAELVDIRVGYDGTTYPTAGDAVRNQITNLKTAIQSNVFSKNLLGPNESVLYPVHTPSNTKVTCYTSDNETGTVYDFQTFDKNGTRTHYWSVPNSGTSTTRTITIPDEVFYVSWRKRMASWTGFPMCEIGASPTGYEEWFPSVKVLDEELKGLTEDTDIRPSAIVSGYLSQNGTWVSSDSFNIKKYPVKMGDTLVLDIGFPYVSSGGVFQFQNNQQIPASGNNYIIGSTYTVAFNGIITVPDEASWLMVVSKKDDDTNTIKVRKVKGLAEVESNIDYLLNDTDRLNYGYKLRNFKQMSDQYKKGNTRGSWYDRFVLLHISDNHVGNTVISFPARNLAELTSISNDKKVDAVINSGDMTIAGSSTLTRDDVNVMFDVYTDLTTDIESQSIPIISTLGNHDANDISTELIAHATTKADQWDHVFEAIANKYQNIVWGDRTGKKHYHYYDIAKGSYKLRIIALDSLDHADYVEGDSSYDCQHYEVYSQSQIDWLCNTALQVPDSSYGIIIINHFPFAPMRSSGYSEEYPALNDGYFVQGWKMIPEIVRAWTDRTTLSGNYPDTKLGLSNIAINADFSSIPDGALFVCYMVGHTHSKNAYIVREENGENFGQLMLCEDSSGQQGSALNRVYKYDDGIQNTAGSQIAVDMNERKVYRTAYGAYQHCSVEQVFPTNIFDF